MRTSPGSTRVARTGLAAVFALLLLALPAQAAPRNVFSGDPVRSGTQSLSAAALPPSVTDSVVKSGFSDPTAIRFAPDGRVFVAEKAGRILVFDSLADPTPTVWADFRDRVHDFWDRGFLGMTLDPNFGAR